MKLAEIFILTRSSIAERRSIVEIAFITFAKSSRKIPSYRANLDRGETISEEHLGILFEPERLEGNP